ncbi:ChaN family lipoprotein [Rhodobacteraceae bacterium NNCM2]|nr:ChaN family lipoprotein [Coraliihabitans acroporae]
MKGFIATTLVLALAACESSVSDQPPVTPIALTQESHPLAGQILDVSTGRLIDPATLTERLSATDLVVIGEVHDNPQHHERQATLVAALAPAGIAFEMVPTASEEGIGVFVEQGGDPGEIGPAIGWDRLGWPDWRYYQPIFEAAADAYIAGGATRADELRTAINTSATEAFGQGAALYGLNIPPDEATQAAIENEMIEAHCNKLPKIAAQGMVEAQRLRDARFAEALIRAANSGGGKAVLITGNGHARTDRGVPAYLQRAVPDRSVLSLGQIEVVPDALALDEYTDGTGLPYDYVWFSARAERADPCASFN